MKLSQWLSGQLFQITRNNRVEPVLTTNSVKMNTQTKLIEFCLFGHRSVQRVLKLEVLDSNGVVVIEWASAKPNRRQQGKQGFRLQRLQDVGLLTKEAKSMTWILLYTSTSSHRTLEPPSNPNRDKSPSVRSTYKPVPPIKVINPLTWLTSSLISLFPAFNRVKPYSPGVILSDNMGGRVEANTRWLNVLLEDHSHFAFDASEHWKNTTMYTKAYSFNSDAKYKTGQINWALIVATRRRVWQIDGGLKFPPDAVLANTAKFRLLVLFYSVSLQKTPWCRLCSASTSTTVPGEY